MLNHKYIRSYLLSLGILGAGYFLSRYLLFDLHGMKDIPDYLALFSFLVIVVSFLLRGKLVPLITSLAYFVSFAMGILFQTDGFDPGGGRTNNLWIIWVVTYLCFILISLVTEAVFSVKKKNK